jgi:hypothetical protein
MSAETIHLLTRNPRGWKNAATEWSMRKLPLFSTPEQNSATITREQNDRWKKIVGREPADSSFTAVIPISNERRHLPSVLATFMLADIPPTVQVNCLLVTNNCTDQGATINVIEDFMASVGNPVRERVDSFDLPFSDPGLEIGFSKVRARHSNTSFFHFDTETSGKINCLEIGSTLALNYKHGIVVCLDANKFPEIDALPKLVGGAYKQLIDTNNPGDVITGIYRGEDADIEENHNLLPTNIPPANLYVKGGIMAWAPQTLVRNGQRTLVSMVDDSALELFVTKRGGNVTVIEDAVNWRYNPESVDSRINHLIRYRISALQLLNQRPELEDLVKEKIFFMKPWGEMKEILTNWANNQELNAELPFILETYQYIINESKRLYDEDPTQLGWDPHQYK